MDNIASYNSDINALRQNITKNTNMLNELSDTEKIEKIKNYQGINEEVNSVLYRERIIFGISSVVAIISTIVTFKMI
jgi:hypothetical protein